MREFDSPDTLAEVLQTATPSPLVAIDGHDGAGKSCLSDQLAALLSWPVIHLDDFVQPDQGGFLDYLRYSELGPRLLLRPMIVEGILVLDVLARLALTADHLVYVKRVSDYGHWYDEEVCDPQEPVEELLGRLAEATNRFALIDAQITGCPEPERSRLSGLRMEVIRYHARVRPASHAHFIYLRRDAG